MIVQFRSTDMKNTFKLKKDQNQTVKVIRYPCNKHVE